MNAVAKNKVEVVELESVRHRRVAPASGSMLSARADRGDDQVSEAAQLIAILADALEKIVETTSDASARAVAAEALVEFHGR